MYKIYFLFVSNSENIQVFVTNFYVILTVLGIGPK